jgi:ADP-ribose pyrophosphatase YjhB (NUDIX family)
MNKKFKNSMDQSSEWPPRFVVCVGTVVLKENNVLLIRQAKGHSLEGQWSIPWGFVDEEETPEHAALRETLEESGVKAEIDGLLGFQNLHKPGWIGIIFLCHHVEGKPSPDGVESDMVSYFSLEDLGSHQEPIETWCEWLVRRVLEGKYTLIPSEPQNPYRPKDAFL